MSVESLLVLSYYLMVVILTVLMHGKMTRIHLTVYEGHVTQYTCLMQNPRPKTCPHTLINNKKIISCATSEEQTILTTFGNLVGMQSIY